MPKVNVKKNESINKALRRFKKQCEKEALIREMRKRRYYIKPGEKRRKRLIRGRKRYACKVCGCISSSRSGLAN